MDVVNAICDGKTASTSIQNCYCKHDGFQLFSGQEGGRGQGRCPLDKSNNVFVFFVKYFIKAQGFILQKPLKHCSCDFVVCKKAFKDFKKTMPPLSAPGPITGLTCICLMNH